MICSQVYTLNIWIFPSKNKITVLPNLHRNRTVHFFVAKNLIMLFMNQLISNVFHSRWDSNRALFCCSTLDRVFRWWKEWNVLVSVRTIGVISNHARNHSKKSNYFPHFKLYYSSNTLIRSYFFWMFGTRAHGWTTSRKYSSHYLDRKGVAKRNRII